METFDDFDKLLQEKYDSIWNSSRESLLNNEVDIDKHLSSISSDKRMGLTVLIPLGEIFDDVMNSLRKIEPEQYFYPASDTHITIIDFVGAYEGFIPDKKQVEIYKKVLSNVLKNIPVFNIKFKGLTASKGAVMVQGFYDKTLQEFR
ncbi:MAG: hypothetical protein JSW73_02675, partial [Candidatus Woesearchaeota archaeon]